MSMPLHAEHTRLGAEFIVAGPETVPLHFGDPVAEHLAVRSAAGVADRSHRGVWHLEGPDASRFLQGTLSNDIAALAPGQGCYALSLTARGKIISEVIVLRRKDDFLMHAPAETREAGFLSLERFLIGDEAQLTDETGRRGIIGVYGPACREVASIIGEEPPDLPDHHFVERVFEGQPILMVGASWTGEKGVEFIAPSEVFPGLWSALMGRVRTAGGRPVGEAALDSLRIEAGAPRGGVDFGEETLPQSAGLEHALSHTKGCYRGQEIVLRIHTKGQVKHSLVGLALEDSDAPLPGPGSVLKVGGREEGWVTSAVFSPTLQRAIALGYLHRKIITAGGDVEVTGSPPRRARISHLPFYRRD